MKNKELISPQALFLIDGSYLLYRSYHAIKPLHTSTGVPTNAVFGFCRALKKIVDTFKPNFLAVIWDSKGGSFRNEVYPAYKAHRPPPPSDLMVQKEAIIDFVKTLGVKNIALAGFEADDLIATIARQKPTKQTVIVCADKDLSQLLDTQNGTLVVDIFKDEIIDAAVFAEKEGYGPDKIPFFYSLVGDASDNIPGVKGIGEKTATDLVKKYDSLEDLYAKLETVEKKRTRELLEADKANAFLSFELFSLVNAPVEGSAKDYEFSTDWWSRANDFFRRYEFTSMIVPVIGASTQQHSLVSQQPVTRQEHSWKTTIVDSQEKLSALHKELSSAKIYAVDTETMGYLGIVHEMVGMSFCTQPGESFYLPFTHQNVGSSRNLDRATTLEFLRNTLENPKHPKVLHHAKFDMHVLQSHGIRLQGVQFDTLIAANLVKDSWEKINLKDLSMRLLNEKMQTYDEVVGKKFKNFSQVAIEDGASYAAHDARQTLLLKAVLEKKLALEPVLQKYFELIDMPFCDLLFRMEQRGVKLDVGGLRAIDTEIDGELVTIEQKLLAAMPAHQLSIDNSFNFSSPKQIEHLLFDVLKLPVVTKTAKGSRSTDQEVLEKLSKLHFIPALILTHRELTKLKTTYSGPLVQDVSPTTGRIHTTFSQTLVATGRLASSNPNLQNIPAYSLHGKEIRGCFIAEEGSLFLSADYSQVELRVLAHISGDKALCDAFHQNKDIHVQTAAELLKIPEDQVTAEQRQLGKKLNFSIMYGLTPYGLAQDLNLSMSEAKTYIEHYFATYSSVKLWMDATVEGGKQTGYVESLWGRRRYIPELLDKNRTVFESGRRVAINTPIQGSTADLMKVTMLSIDAEFRKNNLAAQLLLQIHDEIIVEFPESEKLQVEKIVRSVMETSVAWKVPLKVALRAGKTWGEISK